MEYLVAFLALGVFGFVLYLKWKEKHEHKGNISAPPKPDRPSHDSH